MDYSSTTTTNSDLPVVAEESEFESKAKASRERKESRRKQNPKEEKKRKKVNFSRRREGIRVWETPDFDSLRQTEFMSAIGMIKKSDVLLGKRQGVNAMESSNYSYRRFRREKSPDDLQSRTVGIVLKKLPQLEKRHVHLCGLCEFYDSSKKVVRRHRKRQHLKNRL